MGASRVVGRNEVSDDGKRSLRSARWAGAIDAVGGAVLASILRSVDNEGCVAACGLAESMDLPASDAPFILRGITLYGIDSVMAPMDLRKKAWQRIARDLDLEVLENLTTEIGLADLPAAAEAILAGKTRGRTVVKIS